MFFFMFNDDEFSLSWSPSTLNVGCVYSNGRYGSAHVGVSGLIEGDEVGEQRHARGDIKGYRNTVRKIGKYRNTV